jgi:hypothetical protein
MPTRKGQILPQQPTQKLPLMPSLQSMQNVTQMPTQNEQIVQQQPTHNPSLNPAQNTIQQPTQKPTVTPSLQPTKTPTQNPPQPPQITEENCGHQHGTSPPKLESDTAVDASTLHGKIMAGYQGRCEVKNQSCVHCPDAFSCLVLVHAYTIASSSRISDLLVNKSVRSRMYFRLTLFRCYFAHCK